MSDLGFNVVLRVYDHTERLIRVPITGFRREGHETYTSTKASSMPRFLKCDCGHCDFTTDGCCINDYACGGCGSVVSIINGDERAELDEGVKQ